MAVYRNSELNYRITACRRDLRLPPLHLCRRLALACKYVNVTVEQLFTPQTQLSQHSPCASRVYAPAEPAAPPSADVTREVRRCAERVLHGWRNHPWVSKMVFTAVFTRHEPSCAIIWYHCPTYHQRGPPHTTREMETPLTERLQPTLRGLHVHSPSWCFFSHGPSASAIGRSLGTSRGRLLDARCEHGFTYRPRIVPTPFSRPRLGVRWMDLMALASSPRRCAAL